MAHSFPFSWESLDTRVNTFELTMNGLTIRRLQAFERPTVVMAPVNFFARIASTIVLDAGYCTSQETS